jgi:type VI secretion system protein
MFSLPLSAVPITALAYDFGRRQPPRSGAGNHVHRVARDAFRALDRARRNEATSAPRFRWKVMFDKRLRRRVMLGEAKGRLVIEPSALLEDVLDHLRELFNVRQGSVPIRTDYGMSDFNDMVRQFPDALLELRGEIRRQIVAFEPRLKDVVVRHVPMPEEPLKLVFSVTATLTLPDRSQRVVMETEVGDNGFIRLVA